MNFLAHLFLSGDQEKMMVGNFIGDFVKGSQLSSYPSDIQRGIRLHRAIDQYTDTHEVVLKSKIRLREEFRHYAPVIVDVFYDHFLAKDWAKFSSVSLQAYTQQFYERISKYFEIIPKSVIRMLDFMKRDNWLYNYQFIEGIDQALTGMSRRTKFESKMDEASDWLSKYYDEFQQEFDLFFPQLQSFAEKFEK